MNNQLKEAFNDHPIVQKAQERYEKGLVTPRYLERAYELAAEDEAGKHMNSPEAKVWRERITSIKNRIRGNAK